MFYQRKPRDISDIYFVILLIKQFMYLRNIIKIGGISGPIAGTESYVDYDNSTINSVERGEENNLIVYLVKKDGNLSGKVRINQIDNKDNILEKVLSSKN